MRALESSFWLMNGKVGWRMAQVEKVAVGVDGIRLAAASALDCPLGLGAKDMGLGGLTLPSGMALDGSNLLYLLDAASFKIKRFEPLLQRFVELPRVGGQGDGSRQFTDPSSIAIVGDNLYVVDPGSRRVLVFDLDSLALRHEFGLAQAQDPSVRHAFRPVEIPDFEPYDVAGEGGRAFILDSHNGKVYLHRQGTSRLVSLIQADEAAGRWSRIAIDRAGRIYLLDKAKLKLDVFDGAGKPLDSFKDPSAILDRFRLPGIRLDAFDRFCLPPSLRVQAQRRLPDYARFPAQALAACKPPLGFVGEACILVKAGNGGNGAVDFTAAEVPDGQDGGQGGDVYLVADASLVNLAGLQGKGPFRAETGAEGQPDKLGRDVQIRVPAGVSVYVVGRADGEELLGGPLKDRQKLLVAKGGLGGHGNAHFFAREGEPGRRQTSRGFTGEERRLRLELPLETGLFQRNGEPAVFKGDEGLEACPPLYQASGTWVSQGLDSQTFDCQWHRVELDLADLPTGTKVAVKTYTDAQYIQDQDVDKLLKDEAIWKTRFVLAGQAQPNAQSPLPAPCKTELLVQSPKGQYLWLRLDLGGDGFATPVVSAAVVHYPRDTYMRHLPAVYSADTETRWFLERFLSLAQTEWDGLADRIQDMARYLDPDAVPEGGFLTYLAQWLDLPLEEVWTWAQKRRLLSQAPRAYLRRGTPDGLRRYLRAYLANMTGLAELAEEGDAPAPGLAAFPLVVEGFRLRDFQLLAAQGQTASSQPRFLWGAEGMARLQLGVFATEGKVRLVSTGDPAHDVFQKHAHRFGVYLPSAWIRSQADETMLRRALDTEKPAHTEYHLCLVEPRLRVGVQSTVGMDMIIGDYPSAVLGHLDEAGSAPAAAQATPPASRQPAYRLGYDTVLTGKPPPCGMGGRQGHGMGIETLLY